VLNRTTGRFFDSRSSGSLDRTLDAFAAAGGHAAFDQDAMTRHASRFRRERFSRQLQALIEAAMRQTNV